VHLTDLYDMCRLRVWNRTVYVWCRTRLIWRRVWLSGRNHWRTSRLSEMSSALNWMRKKSVCLPRWCVKNVHPSRAYRSALVSVSLALSQTPVYTAGLVHYVGCLFMPQLWLVLIVRTHGGMARLSWPGWLVAYRDCLPACRRSPIQVLTGPGVDYFVDATNDVTNWAKPRPCWCIGSKLLLPFLPFVMQPSWLFYAACPFCLVLCLCSWCERKKS